MPSIPRLLVVFALCVVCTVAAARDTLAQTADNVAVVINDNSAASRLVGDYYAMRRQIPASHVFHIKTTTDETITRAAYVASIERPLAAAMARENLQDQILYIVLTKGIPLRIEGSSGLSGTVSSVDSELTLLYLQMLGVPPPAVGRIKNPYFLGDRDVSEAHHFTHRDYQIYLVTRLDAFTVDEATGLVDAALAPSTTGAAVLDEREALTNTIGDKWLGAAADRIRKVAPAMPVTLDTTPHAATSSEPVLEYASWGSTDPQLQRRSVGLKFANGSIALTLAGADARTFQAPPPDWVPMKDPQNRSTWFGGSPQSLVGDLIREGATGVVGSVAEPFVQGAPRPDIALPAYRAGFNLVEAFYLATPFLSWQTVVIGDPLCGPFVTTPIPRADLDVGVDAATELPSLFSARRVGVVKAAMKSGQELAPLLVRAEARLARGDSVGARSVLVEVLRKEPTLAGAQLQVAMIDDAAGNRDEAARGYRRVVDLQPENVIALNNLAYDLAVYQHDPAAAKPFAERAVTASKRNATVVDTLAWVEHLLGDNANAAMLLQEAMRGAPENADIQLHAAFVAAAQGSQDAAQARLREALRLNPALQQRDDVRALQNRLPKRP